MRSKYCRYSPDSLRVLSGSPHFNNCTEMPFTDLDKAKQDLFSFGNYKSIICTLFSDPDSRPDFNSLLSEKSSPEVISFVNNFLMKEIQTLPPALSDEDAFNSIIPRSAQSEAEIRPYLDALKQFIADNRSPNDSTE